MSSSCTPMLGSPSRSACVDAAGKLSMNACTPCRKSRWYTNVDVPRVGAPATNSKGPQRASTRSGVEIDASVSAEAVTLTGCRASVAFLNAFRGAVDAAARTQTVNDEYRRPRDCACCAAGAAPTALEQQACGCG